MPAQPTALTSAPRTVPYDGAAPFPGGGDPPLTPGSRPLRVALAVAGSMSFQGEVMGWVAIHRHHHAFTDRPGDPHISAAVIRVFERLGWATAVRWPDPVRLAARRRPSAQDRPQAALPPAGR